MIDRLPTEIVSMIVGYLLPQLGDGRDRHRTAQNSLASLRRVSKLLATAVPLQELYRFPIIDARRDRKPLVSFLHSLREMHLLLSAVVNLALIVSNKHTWCRQAFQDHLGTPYLTATRNLVLHSTSQSSRTADYTMLTSMLELFPSLETLTADGVSLDFVTSSMLYDAIKGSAHLQHILLERASVEAIILLLSSSSKKEPNAVIEITQLADGPDEGNLYLTWTSGERRARGPLAITMSGLDESPTPCVFRSYRATAEGRAVGETVRRVSALGYDLFAALDTRILANRHFRINIYSRLCEGSRDTIVPRAPS